MIWSRCNYSAARHFRADLIPGRQTQFSGSLRLCAFALNQKIGPGSEGGGGIDRNDAENGGWLWWHGLCKLLPRQTTRNSVILMATFLK